MAISLDAIGEHGGVIKNLCPTGQIEPCLRSEIWKLDGDRHEGMRRQKRESASNCQPLNFLLNCPIHVL